MSTTMKNTIVEDTVRRNADSEWEHKGDETDLKYDKFFAFANEGLAPIKYLV